MSASAAPAPTKEEFSQDLSSDYGLVSPEGQFYDCGFCGHTYLARCLGLERGILSRGWIHVAEEAWDFEYADDEMNQKQIDCLFAWVQAAPEYRSYSRVMARFK